MPLLSQARAPERIAAESLLLVNPEEYRERRGERYGGGTQGRRSFNHLSYDGHLASAAGSSSNCLTGAIGDERTGTELLHLL